MKNPMLGRLQGGQIMRKQQPFVQTQPRCKPDGMVYMDGSRDKVPTAGLVTGAGVYRSMSTAHLGLTVCPNEQGMLYTVNRAEMVATL